jgi:hypothetical protein
MDMAPVRWSPWSGLTFGRAPPESGQLNVDNTAAASVELLQNIARVDIVFTFELASLVVAILKSLGLTLYLGLLLLIKILTLLACKPWLFLIVIVSCVGSQIWLQDAEIQKCGATNAEDDI